MLSAGSVLSRFQQYSLDAMATELKAQVQVLANDFNNATNPSGSRRLAEQRAAKE